MNDLNMRDFRKLTDIGFKIPTAKEGEDLVQSYKERSRLSRNMSTKEQLEIAYKALERDQSKAANSEPIEIMSDSEDEDEEEGEDEESEGHETDEEEASMRRGKKRKARSKRGARGRSGGSTEDEDEEEDEEGGEEEADKADGDAGEDIMPISAELVAEGMALLGADGLEQRKKAWANYEDYNVNYPYRFAGQHVGARTRRIVDGGTVFGVILARNPQR